MNLYNNVQVEKKKEKRTRNKDIFDTDIWCIFFPLSLSRLCANDTEILNEETFNKNGAGSYESETQVRTTKRGNALGEKYSVLRKRRRETLNHIIGRAPITHL